MNSLFNLRAYGKKAVIAITLVASVALGVAAQRVEPQSQGKMYGDPGFRGEPINLKIVNMDIRDVLGYITEQYGINFVIDKSVQNVPITVNINDIPWNVALDSILQSQELDVRVNGSILRIASAKQLAEEDDIRAKIENSRLDTSPLLTEFIRLNYARASGTLSGASGGTDGFNGGSSGGESSGAGSGGGGGDTGILGIIRRRLSRRGAVEVDGRSNTLIITDVRQNIDAIRQLVTLLDQPEPQVEIEARIVIAQRNFLREIGLQIGFSGNPFTKTEGGGITGQTGRPGDAVPTGLLQLTTGIFGTAQITAALNLSESKGQSKTIASPRVTALNNRSAQIESGSQIPVTTVQRGGGGDEEGGAIVYTTTFVQVPLRLSVTPQITDAGTVIMRVVAENNTVDPSLSSGLGGTPGIQMQRMQTEVLVPDGGTTVVGGVLTDLEVGSKAKVPGVGDIPIIKYLFRNKSTQRNTSEILFFITPRIYRPDYEGNPTSGKVSTGNRTTTIIQPVPLGNPSSNSDPQPTPQQLPNQPLPLVPVQSTTPPATPNRP